MSNEQKYRKNPILFLEERYVLPETRKKIKLQAFQKDFILKPLFYDLDEKGHRKYNIALIGEPKKNGKSAFAAGIGVYFLICEDVFGEIIIAANARDQASMIIYNKMRRSIMLDEQLKAACSPMHKEKIEVYSTGTVCRTVAHQYETAAGLNPNLTIFDELWGFSDRKFFDELTVVPTRANPLIIIVTYAGYEESGLLWDLYSDGLAGDDIIDTGDPEIIVRRGKRDKGLFMFWSNKNLASWVTEKYLLAQRNRLPPEVFARLHQNKWVSAGSKFITQSDIDAVHNVPWMEQLAPIIDRYVHYVIATDLGLSHDRAARVVGHYDPQDGNVYIDSIRIWQGAPSQHVPIKEVEQDLLDCAAIYRTSQLVVDPWQMEYVIQRLKDRFQVHPFNFTADMAHLSQVLINVIRTQHLKCYQMDDLDFELKNTIIKQTAAGWRIEHPVGRINDIVVAVGMLIMETLRGTELLEVPGDDEFTEKPIGSIFGSGGIEPSIENMEIYDKIKRSQREDF